LKRLALRSLHPVVLLAADPSPGPPHNFWLHSFSHANHTPLEMVAVYSWLQTMESLCLDWTRRETWVVATAVAAALA
jgi:hypothetical protein